MQRNLAANCGINFSSLAEFLGTIAVRQIQRLSQATSAQEDDLFEAFSLRRCTLALKALLNALKKTQVGDELSHSISEQQLGEAKADLHLPSAEYSKVSGSLLSQLLDCQSPTELCCILHKLIHVCESIISTVSL